MIIVLKPNATEKPSHMFTHLWKVPQYVEGVVL